MHLQQQTLPSELQLQEAQAAQSSSSGICLSDSRAVSAEQLACSCSAAAKDLVQQHIHELQQATSDNSRMWKQHSMWMQRLPQLLHWKQTGSVLARRALRTWAAIAAANKRRAR